MEMGVSMWVNGITISKTVKGHFISRKVRRS